MTIPKPEFQDDFHIVAAISGSTLFFDKKVLNGERSHSWGKGAMVVVVAKKIMETRKISNQLPVGMDSNLLSQQRLPVYD